MKMIGKYRKIYRTAAICLVLAGFFVLFGFLYRHDNKYTAGPPYGRDGQFSFSEKDLSNPLFLIDGWEFYPDRLLTPEETADEGYLLYIGQYPTFSAFHPTGSPFGAGTYRLTLSYDGKPRILTLEIPEIFTDYTLWIGGEKAAVTGSGPSVSFLMDQEITLTLQTENYTHYYSGLTYPPALGTPEIINRLFFVRNLFYQVLWLVPLTLALFSIAVWLIHGHDALFRHFGLLCLGFSVPVLHPFLWQAGLTGQFWYALEDASWCFVLTQAAAIASISAGFYDVRWFRKLITPLTAGLTLLSFIWVYGMIPSFPAASAWYGTLTALYRTGCFVFLILCAAKGIYEEQKDGWYTLAGGVCLGMGLYANILDNNRFEPIYTGWQLEYAGFFLVLIFGGLMVRRNLLLIRQGKELELVTLLNRMAKESAASIRQNMDQVRAVKHEMAHHISALEALEAAGEYKRLKEYLVELHKKKEAIPPLYYCENYLVNAILSNCLSAASRAGIRVSCRASLPEELNLPDTELCILFSNLLDNASEACALLPGDADRFIDVDIHMDGRLLSVLCRNAMKERRRSSGFPSTTKAFPEEHGFGLRAMESVVEKYEGALDISEDQNVFTVKLLLYIPSPV